MFINSEFLEMSFPIGPLKYSSAAFTNFKNFALFMFSTGMLEPERSTGRPKSPKYFSRKLSTRSASFPRSLSVAL
ncbi:hypothetical protein FR483_n245L [Paramecium bursaria Chlorella virus FR483]|uniref:Uncharacterized protein n245L n=1 Tax=Paramecium bursaria Chlorella virus FR483 TaxID=399781 RepID=A7J6U9_PBCVF|nr:hypothetical protein FR483_n245L [Paramecium bursaria Chlorella virus FR483]ABT15530.1 hypothetical protein FR483_n245L [Paramecium bursaria Chlorella virus FR483]